MTHLGMLANSGASLLVFEATHVERHVALARAFLDNPHWGWRAAQALSADVARPVQYQRSAAKLWPGAASQE